MCEQQLKSFNCVETKAILVSKQISLPTKKLQTNILDIMDINLNVCKQITDVKLSLLYRDTCNHLTVNKKKCVQDRWKIVYKPYIWYICINMI